MTDQLPKWTDPNTAYANAVQVANRLGRQRSWFDGKREDLERQGFPKIDPIIRLYMKADVDAWIETRRQIEKKQDLVQADPIEGVNLNGL